MQKFTALAMQSFMAYTNKPKEISYACCGIEWSSFW